MVHRALHRVPCMFQIWVCKQVVNIASTNGNRQWEKDLCPLCLSCGQDQETCAHILSCNHMGRVKTLMHSIDLLEHWLVEVDTDPDLRNCVVAYARGKGGITMTKICSGMDHRYRKVAEEQDAISWRRFMDGMICCEPTDLQEIYTTVEGSNITGEQWSTGVIINLIETTCVQVNDRIGIIKQHSKRRSCKWLSKHSKTWAGRVYWKRINIWRR